MHAQGALIPTPAEYCSRCCNRCPCCREQRSLMSRCKNYHIPAMAHLPSVPLNQCMTHHRCSTQSKLSGRKHLHQPPSMPFLGPPSLAPVADHGGNGEEIRHGGSLAERQIVGAQVLQGRELDYY